MQRDEQIELPQVEGIEHRFVDANGLRVHVAEAAQAIRRSRRSCCCTAGRSTGTCGAGDRRPGTEHRLIAPDLRGFGWTEAPGRGYDAETFAADQVALLDALGIERANVIGHDWGGWAAFLLGLLHPERIERLMAFNAPHPWARITPRLAMEGWRSWYTWMLATPGVGPQLARQGWVARTILTRGNVGDPFTQEEIDGYVGSFRERSRALAVSRLYRYYQRVFREVVSGRWRNHRLTVPTRIVFGERDRYVSPRLLPGYERYADDMEVELVPDSGHFVVDEKPDLVVDRLRQFFG